MADEITRAEFDATVARLDRVDGELRQEIATVERTLRSEFVAGVTASETRLSTRMDRIDTHLTEQDNMWLDFFKSTRTWVLSSAGMVVGYLILHFVFHIG